MTETYLPEINGVAITMGHLVRGLCARGHHVELIRPRQRPAEMPAQRLNFDEVLPRGVAIPRYDALKIGLPAKNLRNMLTMPHRLRRGSSLFRRWSSRRPDIVHLVTEGPLGWSALSAAQALGLPVATDFHTKKIHCGLMPASLTYPNMPRATPFTERQSHGTGGDCHATGK